MIVQLNENVKCNAKRKIKNICICLLLFFFAFAIMIRYQRCGALAQLVARDIRIVEVRSSNLLCSTIYDEIRTLLHLRKRDVRMHLPKRRWAKRSSVKTPGLFVFHPEEKCKVVHIKGEILGYPDFTFIFVCASAKKPWRIFLLPIYSRAHARGALSQLKDEWNP